MLLLSLLYHEHNLAFEDPINIAVKVERESGKLNMALNKGKKVAIYWSVNRHTKKHTGSYLRRNTGFEVEKASVLTETSSFPIEKFAFRTHNYNEK